MALQFRTMLAEGFVEGLDRADQYMERRNIWRRGDRIGRAYAIPMNTPLIAPPNRSSTSGIRLL